jgi:hypothetical protein
VVLDAVLRGPRDVCASSWWDVAGVDDFAEGVVKMGSSVFGEMLGTFGSSIAQHCRVRIVMNLRRMGIAPSPRGHSLCREFDASGAGGNDWDMP